MHIRSAKMNISGKSVLKHNSAAMRARSSGVAKAGPGRARARPKAPCMFVPFMSRNLVRSALERLAYSQVPGQYE